jgi:Dehydrogenases with different specificities (related to short-chain alcohol dehydrogenases)
MTVFPRVIPHVYASLQHRRRLEGRGETVREGWERAHGYTCDVTDRYQVAEMAQRVLKDFGRVDILVNNAPNTAEPHVRAAEVVVDVVKENLLSHFWVSCKFVEFYLRGVRKLKTNFQITDNKL